MFFDFLIFRVTFRKLLFYFYQELEILDINHFIFKSIYNLNSDISTKIIIIKNDIYRYLILSKSKVDLFRNNYGFYYIFS